MKIDRIINKKYFKTFLCMCSGVNKIDCITYKLNANLYPLD